MAEPADPGHRLHALLNALADDLATMSDGEVLAEAMAEGRDVARDAEDLRRLMLETACPGGPRD